MMSLKEEIYHIVKLYACVNEDDIVTDATKRIISMIEKRIDSQYKTDRAKSDISEDFDNGMYYFYKKVKEMLK